MSTTKCYCPCAFMQGSSFKVYYLFLPAFVPSMARAGTSLCKLPRYPFKRLYTLLIRL